MKLEAGQRIGPYQILSVIGSGGMGTVYLASDTRLHRKVALKFIQPDHTADADVVVGRLLNEARAASALNHPNVCQVYDVGGSDERSVADLGTFSALAVFFDVSRDGVVTWAPFQPGRQELWTATLTR